MGREKRGNGDSGREVKARHHVRVPSFVELEVLSAGDAQAGFAQPGYRLREKQLEFRDGKVGKR
jgi:hypothetical protein